MTATSQLSVVHRHQDWANPKITDAILDRLVQPTYRFELGRTSLRNQQFDVTGFLQSRTQVSL